MTTQIQTKDRSISAVWQIGFVAALGMMIIFTSGLAHSQTLHDAAHDVRHASGFPCH